MYLLDDSHGDHILPAAAPSTDVTIAQCGGGEQRTEKPVETTQIRSDVSAFFAARIIRKFYASWQSVSCLF